MPIKAVVFDIGGVLEVNPRTGWQDRWAARLQLELADLESCLGPIWSPGATGGTTLEEIERQTADALSLDEVTLAELMEDAWAEYLGRLNVELAQFLVSLRPRYRTGIVSNSFVGARERERAAYGLEEMCDVIVYSHEVGFLKPDPRIYRIACDELDVLPEEAVFVDDVPACVVGARELGMKPVTFLDNAQAIDEVLRHLAE